MNVQKTVKKIAALSGGALMVGATMMGAMAYDLADYPTPFITDGVFDGTIVVGASAATQDVIGSIDIAASLQAMSITQEAVDVPGYAGEVSLGENAFRFEAGNDLLEIREPMGNIYDSLTEAELPALAGGVITTDEGSTDYNQYLNFAGNDTSDGLQPIGVNYAENKYDEVGDFLVIDDDESFFEWELTFSEGLESSVESGELDDLENEVFNIFGTEYTFVNSDYSAPELTLEFMAGDVSSTLREGETKTFTIDGVEYEVTLIFVSDPSGGGTDPEAKFMVNGEVTDSMTDGETDTLSGGFEIGVRDLLVNSREGVVEFFLGAEKISFTDNNVGDTNYYNSGVEIGSEDIDDVLVKIEATITVDGSNDGDAEISNIMYKLEANPTKGSTFYIAPGTGVREYMEEPEALLSPTFDIRYEGLKSVATNPVEFSTNGDDEYEISLTNAQNKEFSWPIINAKDQNFRFGEEDDSFVFVEAGFTTADGADFATTGTMLAIAGAINDTLLSGVAANATLANATFNIWQDDYFVVSDVEKLEKANSYIMSYDTISTSENTITFVDLDGGKYKVQYTPFSGEGGVLGYTDKLRVGGNTFKVWILNEEDSDYPVAIDLDGDGDLGAGTATNFTVKGGAILDFANAVNANGGTPDMRNVSGHGLNIGDAATSHVNMTLMTLNTEFDTSGDGDETISWRISADADDEVDINGLGFTEPAYLTGTLAYNDVEFISEDSGDLSHTYTSYGAYVTLDEPSSSPATFVIDYPETQVGAQVFVVAGAVTRSEAAGGVSREVVNPISVGLAVLDSDAPALGSANMIVVGGPAANTVAAELLGNPSNPAEGFTPGKAMIRSFETSGKVALLVAGYEAQETQGASYVLANYGDYAAFQGEEVEVVVPDLSNIVVQAATVEMMDDERRLWSKIHLS